MSGYKFENPHDWLTYRINACGDVHEAMELCRSLATLLDGDQIQDCFQGEMDDDGYFAAEGAHDRNPATIDTYRIEYTGAPCGPGEYCIEAEGLTEQGAINYVRETQAPANRERRIRSEQTGEIVEVYEGRQLRVPIYGGEVGR